MALPPIACMLGPLGVGKSYVMTWHVIAQMKRQHRLALTQYAVDGAIPLRRITDLLHRDAAGAVVALDEINTIFPAREWTKEDDIEVRVIENIRHNGQQLLYAAHGPGDVTIHLRKSTGVWILIRRIGPDPTAMIVQGKHPNRWQRPRAFKLTAYAPGKPPDHLPALTRPTIMWRQRIGFKEDVAMRYDTGERIWTDAQEQEIERRLSGAEQRLHGEPWRVEGGKIQGMARRLQRARDELRDRSTKPEPPSEDERVRSFLAGMPQEQLDALSAALAELDAPAAEAGAPIVEPG